MTLLHGASSDRVMFFVELKWSTTATADTTVCSQLMLLIVQFHFVSGAAGQLDMTLSSVPTFASKRNEVSPQIKQIDFKTGKKRCYY